MIQKAKKTYSDTRGRRNLSNLNTELQDVQRIMVQNIDDVLQRGAVLSELENKSQNLTEMSRKYKKDAESLNATSLAVIAGLSWNIFSLREGFNKIKFCGIFHKVFHIFYFENKLFSKKYSKMLKRL